MNFSTPRRIATGLGSAGQGTHHWWAQRVSAIALIPLGILFILPFAQVLGEDYATVRAMYADPFHALISILFLGVCFHHLQQGLQVVIEDYVHHKAWRTGLLLGSSMFCALMAISGIFAVLRIAFTA